MNATPNQISRVTEEYSLIAKEEVTVEMIVGTMYVFGSELAMLRLHYKMAVGRIGYSENLDTWFYTNG